MSEWFGTLPKEWEAIRINNLFSENVTSNSTIISDIPMQFKYGEIICKKTTIKDEDFLESIRRYVVVQPNDIMINGLNLNYDFVSQRVAIVRETGCMTPAYISMRPNNNINPMYGCYLIKAMDSQKLLHGLGMGIRLTLGFAELKKISLPLPPRTEQDQIVRYLDWKVSGINRLINAKKKQIALLGEQKRAVINEAVTGTQIKVRNIGRIQGRIGFKGYSANDLVDPETKGCSVVLGGTNIMRDGTINYNKLTFLSEYKYFESPEIMLNGGEILITKVGAGVGEAGIYDGRFDRATINPNVMILFVNDNQNPKYINYCLNSDAIKIEIKLESTKSGAQPAINQGFIKNVFLLIPSYEIQNTIVLELDDKCGKIEEIISKISTEISLLGEYKTRLISDVVTGKKNVSGIVVPEYETVEESASDACANEEETEQEEE